MNDNTRKTPATFFFDEKDGGKFALSIVVENMGVTDRYALKGTIARQLGIVTLDELEHNMPEGVRLSDLFQATVLRVTSLYTGYALRKFYIANELVKYFSECTITDAPNAYNLPAVKVEETLQLSKAAAEMFDVTCTNMYAILTHDPEEVVFQKSWMDTTSQMMLNAVFEIPKMWTSNINASGIVAHDEHTDWVWNYSPSTEILIIHVHDRTNKKHSQWEVTRDLAIHFTGTDRENGTHYRSFINHEGGRQWHVTRKVIVQRAYITELPAGTTKSVFKQIKHVLHELQANSQFQFEDVRIQPEYLEWLSMPLLEASWRGADGKLPIEPPVALREAYLYFMFRSETVMSTNRQPGGEFNRSTATELFQAMYGLLAPTYVPRESEGGRFHAFLRRVEFDTNRFETAIKDKSDERFAAKKPTLLELLPAVNLVQRMKQFVKSVKDKESEEDEEIGH